MATCTCVLSRWNVTPATSLSTASWAAWVPKQYIPHVDKGCQDALARGVISGNPVVDVCVELFFGSYHNVDSSELAFKLAASKAIQEGIKQCNPCLLEPIMEIAVTVPEEYMGDINGDLNSRRGRILGMDPLGGGRQCVRANVPEAEVPALLHRPAQHDARTRHL